MKTPQSESKTLKNEDKRKTKKQYRNLGHDVKNGAGVLQLGEVEQQREAKRQRRLLRAGAPHHNRKVEIDAKQPRLARHKDKQIFGFRRRWRRRWRRCRCRCRCGRRRRTEREEDGEIRHLQLQQLGAQRAQRVFVHARQWIFAVIY